jgi:hypothetical protein
MIGNLAVAAASWGHRLPGLDQLQALGLLSRVASPSLTPSALATLFRSAGPRFAPATNEADERFSQHLGELHTPLRSHPFKRVGKILIDARCQPRFLC